MHLNNQWLGKVVGMALLPLLLSLPSVGQNKSANNEQDRNAVGRVDRTPSISLEVDNSENPAISIQVASAKEIAGHKFEQLTRTSPGSARYTSCPTTRVVNTTGRAIKAFALGLMNRNTNTLDIVRITSHPLVPFEEFQLEPAEWAKARKKGTKTFTHNGGVSAEDKRVIDWGSEEMWFPGVITDYYIFVGEVEFSDGTRWFTKR